MKNLICILVAAFSMTMILACSPGGAASQDRQSVGISESGNCLDAYQVCIGDTIYDVRDWTIFDLGTVTEVVLAGQLSKQERDYLARLHGESARRAEETLLETARKLGARIFAEMKTPVIRQTSFSESMTFSRIYRTKGCASDRSTCNGEKFLALDDHRFVHQQLVAIQITDRTQKLSSGYLVQNVSDGEANRPKLVLDITPVTTSGCSILDFSKHRFCVGDAFFPISYQHSISKSDRKEIVAFTVPANGKQASAVVKIYDKVFDLFRTPAGNFNVYVDKGCVQGIPELCFPKIAGETLLWVNGGFPSDVYTAVSDVTRLQMIGIALEDTPSADERSVLFHQDEAMKEFNIFAPDFISTNFYRTVGCGTSKNICVGDTVHYISEGDYVSMPVIGYNSSSDQLIGQIPIADKKFDTRTIAVKNLR